MKPGRFAYIRPDTVDEALAELTRHAGAARVLAGGQSLVPMLHMRLMQPAAVIDINRIPELARIETRGAGIAIGALTRYSAIEASPLVAERLPLLQNVVRHVGDRQIRNRGTLGGSLAQADPVGEMILACLALDATVVVRSSAGTRELAIEELVLGAYTTVLEPDELIVEVRFPESPGACAFFELGRRHNDFAVIALAAVGDPQPDGSWHGLRVALAGGDDHALLVRLADSTLDDAAIDSAVDDCLRLIDPSDDVRASAEYRRHLVAVHVARLLRSLRDDKAVARA
jgi:aerobic carbon-monoxide dehydrogenase medium subunit